MLAKIYTQPSTPEGTRAAIEKVIRARVPANFAAQLEVFRGAETPETLKSTLEKDLLKQNEAAVKAALKLATDEKGKPAASGGSPFSPTAGKSALPSLGGGLFGAVGKLFGGGSSPSPAANPFGGMASITPAEIQKIAANVQKRMEAAASKGRRGGTQAKAAPVPQDVMLIEIFGEVQKKQPVDLGLVAKDLWTPEFVESIAKALSENKGNAEQFVSALASVPTNVSREKLRELLHKQRTQGPAEFAKMEPAAPTEAGAGAASAENRRRGKGKRDGASGTQPMGGRRRNVLRNGDAESGQEGEARSDRIRDRMVRPWFARRAEIDHSLLGAAAGETDASIDVSATGAAADVGRHGKAAGGQGRKTKGARCEL